MIPHDMLYEKVQVQEVAAASPAQLAGIQPGDTILEINAAQLKTAAMSAISFSSTSAQR